MTINIHLQTTSPFPMFTTNFSSLLEITSSKVKAAILLNTRSIFSPVFEEIGQYSAFSFLAIFKADSSTCL